MDQLATVGIDLAKDVFAVCILDVTGSMLSQAKGTGVGGYNIKHGHSTSIPGLSTIGL